MINPLSTEYEVAHCLDVSQPKVLAADVSTWATLSGAAKRTGFAGLKTISLHDSQPPFQDVRSWILFLDIANREEVCHLAKLLSQKESLAAFDLSNKDSREHTAVVCFSSGTSGKAKGVELSHYNLVASMLGIRATEPFYWAASIRGVFFAPLCHIYGTSTPHDRNNHSR